MEGDVWIGRGTTIPRVLTGKIESLKYLGKPAENYLRISGRCLGERLFRRVFTGTFLNQKGEDIVKYLLDNYVGLSHVRDSTELVEATDTTYTKLEYENTPVYDIIKQIADSADKQGVIGFDFRVAPDGKFEFFPKNSKTSSVSLSEVIEEYEYRKDIHTIRNKVWVYGVSGATMPRNRDRWTETTTSMWQAISSNTTISLVSSNPTPAVGSYCIKVYRGTGDVPTLVRARCNFTDEDGSALVLRVKGREKLKFQVRNISGKSYAVYIYLLAPNTSNYFKYCPYFMSSGSEWVNADIPLGEANEYSASNPNGVWEKVGNANWKDLRAIDFEWGELPTQETWLAIDGLHFTEQRFKAVAQDTGSQSAYGLRELVETDEELYNDTECSYRANALLNHLKSPIEHITVKTTVLDYGNTPILAGDRIYVSLPNEGVAGYYRVESVEYHVDAKTQTLEVTLKLGKEQPLLADYIYALKSKTDHLSRYKQAR